MGGPVSSGSVERDHFPIENCGGGIQLDRRRDDGGIGRREVLLIPGDDPHLPGVLDHQRTVAIQLHLVEPLLALGEGVDQGGGHRRDEGGT